MKLGKQAALFLSASIGAALVLAYAPSLLCFDFSMYWKSGQLLLAGENPYAVPHQSEYLGQSESGLPHMRMMGSPFSLVPILPFAFFGLDSARKIYIAVLCLGLLASALILRVLYRKSSGVTAVLTLAFGALALRWGSPTFISLLGITLVLWCMRYRHHVGAGFVLVALLSLKPHLLIVPISGLIAGDLRAGRGRVLLGVLCGASLATVGLLALNPQVFLQFYEAARDTEAFNYRTATLPSLLLGHIKAPLLLFAPVIIGTIMAVAVHWKNLPHSIEDFIVYSIPLSLILAPYAWGHDYILLIPSTASVLAHLGACTTPESSKVFARVQILFIAMGMLVGLFSFLWLVPDYLYLLFPTLTLYVATLTRRVR